MVVVPDCYAAGRFQTTLLGDNRRGHFLRGKSSEFSYLRSMLKITYYLDVISSWCYWVEPAWAELKARYAGRVEFQWKLALLDATGLPSSRQQEEWFYRRSGTIMHAPFMLNSEWFEPNLKEYLAPNLVAEAAKDFGVRDDRARLALAEAALRHGRRVAQGNVAAEVAASASGLDAKQLLARANTPEIEARARASTKEFQAFQINQRPAFLLEDPIGDRAVFSGLVASAPLVATLEAMLHDTAAYASHAAHFGAPPKE
jgi:predicted DsbA family dithiol-disulfide isomerase